MPRHQLIFTAVCALIIGPLSIYISYLMISDLPSKSELIWLSSEDVVQTDYKERNGLIQRICFYANDGRCLSVSKKKDGFAELLHATHQDYQYSIGYNKEGELLANDGKLYNVIYEIRVNENIVKPYKDHIEFVWIFFGGVGVFGFLCLGWLVYLPFQKRAEQS